MFDMYNRREASVRQDKGLLRTDHFYYHRDGSPTADSIFFRSQYHYIYGEDAVVAIDYDLDMPPLASYDVYDRFGLDFNWDRLQVPDLSMLVIPAALNVVSYETEGNRARLVLKENSFSAQAKMLFRSAVTPAMHRSTSFPEYLESMKTTNKEISDFFKLDYTERDVDYLANWIREIVVPQDVQALPDLEKAAYVYSLCSDYFQFRDYMSEGEEMKEIKESMFNPPAYLARIMMRGTGTYNDLNKLYATIGNAIGLKIDTYEACMVSFEEDMPMFLRGDRSLSAKALDSNNICYLHLPGEGTILVDVNRKRKFMDEEGFGNIAPVRQGLINKFHYLHELEFPGLPSDKIVKVETVS